MSACAATNTERRIGVGHLAIGATERRLVNEALDAGRLSYGPLTRRFEQEFASLHDLPFAAFCNSGTSALQAALHALRIRYHYQDGDEVLVPAVTFVATVNVVLQNGLRPVLVDVDPRYYEIDSDRIEAAITERTVALIPVHLGGLPCAMDRISAIAQRHGLQVLEDSCETMFARYQGRPVGSWGDAAAFSTYVAHVLTTGVGGFACSRDPETGALIRSLLNHGRDGIYLSIDDDACDGARLREVVSKRFRFDHVGYSYRATELEAAIGLGQLERWHADGARRDAIAAALSAGLRDCATLQLPSNRPGVQYHGWMFYPLVTRRPVAPLIAFLEERGIETRPLLPLIDQPCYRGLGLSMAGQFPIAEHLGDHAFYVGCHAGLDDADVDYLIETIREGVRRADVL